jgi:ABC-2 family transporter protein
MIWLTLRQQRIELAVATLLVTLLGVALILSGRDMFAAYQQAQHGASVVTCALSRSQDPICDALTGDFRRQYGDLSVLLLTLTVLPGLAGMFLGAPLVAREIERGTHRLAWTQTITRRHWIGVKVGALVTATAILFTAFSLLLMWWCGPLDEVSGSRFSYGFDLEGLTPVAYALFAVALGLVVGALARRTLPAMAITLGGFIAVRGIIEFLWRPRYLPPVALITDPSQGNSRAYDGDWVLNNGFTYLDSQGHPINSADVVNICTGLAKGASADFSTCLSQHGVRLLSLYQPGDRFWLFQGIESAIFLLLAVILIALTIWIVRRRIA